MRTINVDVLDGCGTIQIVVGNGIDEIRIKDYFKDTKKLFDEVAELRERCTLESN